MKRNAPFLLLIAIVALSGCGGASQPTGPSILVTLTTAPPSSLAAGAQAIVAATVTNDMAAGGVNWSCTPASACGSFSVTSTASGASTTYTAPPAAPAGGQVSIIATSVTNVMKNASSSVMITGTALTASLKGQYALLITSATGQLGASVSAASVIADGNGLITGGVEELTAPGSTDLSDAVTDGTYSIDANGRGTMLIHTALKETLKFDFVLTSATHALIIENDGTPSSGTMDLQQPTGGSFTAADIKGNYSFAMDGVDNSGAIYISMAGTFSADGIGTLTSGTLDINNGGTFSTSPFLGSFTAPDSNGRGTMTVNTGRSFIYYVISPKVLRVLEGDNTSFVGGSAYAQGSGTTNAALSGKFVYQHRGWSTPGRTVAAGQLSADGMGKITTGVSDSNSGGSPTTVTKGTAVTGTYLISGSPSGTLNLTDAAGASTFNLYLVDPTLNILDPSNSSDGGGALLLHTDASIIGSGILIPQVVSGTPSFSNNHAVNLINSVDPDPKTKGPNEVDLAGRVASDGSANFNGAADYGQSSAFVSNVVTGNTLTGTFAADGANVGHFTGSFTFGTDPTIALFPFLASGASTFNVSFYQASDSQALVIQTDTSADTWGYLIKQQLP
jgi:hypothetical protein